MNKQIVLTIAVALCASSAFASAKLTDDNSHGYALEKKSDFSLSSRLLLVQAQAPGRPLTPQEQTKPAPEKPVKDTVAPTAPPSPGTPNFPQRPPNDPPLKNPLK